MKQWFRGVDENEQSSRWTVTHGFFLQMGGFILREHGKPISVLTFKRLVTLIEAGEIDIPTITEKEMFDKSKGDFLTKLFVVVQTTWFVVQCLARWASQLPVTELEVVTLAFATLNVVTYSLWWQKPQSTRVAFPIELNTNIEAMHAIKCRSCGNRLASVMSLPISPPPNQRAEGLNGINLLPRVTESDESRRSWFRERMQWGLWAVGGGGLFAWIKFVLWQIPMTLLRGFLRPLYKMAGDVDLNVEAGSTRLPMFYAHNLGSQMLFASIAFLFGGLHLLSWKVNFPSVPEMWLWRSCALFITTEPVVLLLYRRFWTHELNNAVDLAVMVSLTFYCLARLVLVILSWTTLRALPQTAYYSVHWTSFLPHI